MKAIQPESLAWETQDGLHRFSLFCENPGEVRVELLEVPGWGNLAPHRHPRQRLFLCVTRSAGAQLYLGGRLFRPLAGQVFECEPGDVVAVQNDTPHEIRLLMVRLGACEDREAVDQSWKDLVSGPARAPA